LFICFVFLKFVNYIKHFQYQIIETSITMSENLSFNVSLTITLLSKIGSKLNFGKNGEIPQSKLRLILNNI